MTAVATLPIIYDTKNNEILVPLGLEKGELTAFWGNLEHGDTLEQGAKKELEEESLGMFSFMLSTLESVKCFGNRAKVYVPVTQGYNTTETVHTLQKKFNAITKDRQRLGKSLLGAKVVSDHSYYEIEKLCYCKLKDLMSFLVDHKSKILETNGGINEGVSYYYFNRNNTLTLSTARLRNIFCDKLVRDKDLFQHLCQLNNNATNIPHKHPEIKELLSGHKYSCRYSEMKCFMNDLITESHDLITESHQHTTKELEKEYKKNGGGWLATRNIFGFFSYKSLLDVETILHERADKNPNGASEKTLLYVLS